MKKINISFGGFFTTLFLIFLILKLVGVISWSWGLIFLPLFIPFLIAVIIITLTICLTEFE